MSRQRNIKSVFCCSQCGAQAPKWAGQCGDCGAWNTLSEDVVAASGPRQSKHMAGIAGAEIATNTDTVTDTTIRTATGFAEFDRVLGKGLVQGSVVLIGGDPGIGKSTILLQVLASLGQKLPVLYVTGEESLQQVSLSANRLGIPGGSLRILPETQLERILTLAEKDKPKVMVIDSIQTVSTDLLQSAPGSVSQVRECAAALVQFAKRTGTALFLVGHVTKEGTLAGPRVLEHMVDTVLYFEGDADSHYRVIRAIKNRFGAINEMGVFAMTEKGLRGVNSPSAIFLSRHEKPVSGSIIMVTREGTRPLLVEVQALLTDSHLPNPRRVTVGLDQTRLVMLLAVLQRHGGITLGDQDVFVNVVGGLRVTETAADLALVLAMLSSFRDKVLDNDMIVFGEIGLAGEIRPVQNGQDRLKAAAQHGFKRAIIPKANQPRQPIKGIEVIAVQTLAEALEYL